MPPSRAARAWEDDEPYGRSEPRSAEVHPFPQRRTIQIRGQVPPPRRAAPTGRRRPAPRRAERLAARPDRAAGWAVLLGIFLVLVAAASSHAAAFGARTLGPRMRGEDVRILQRLLDVSPTGYFGTHTKASVRRFQRHAGLAVDGRVGPISRAALARRRMGRRTASSFGPGLYGRHTACGQQLTPSLRGIAHRRLPCDSLVTLEHGGRFLSARVVDRGPYVDGVTLDVTRRTARALALHGTDAVRVRYQAPSHNHNP